MRNVAEKLADHTRTHTIPCMEAAGFLNENEPKDEDNLKVKKKQAGAELCQAQGKLKLARL